MAFTKITNADLATRGATTLANQPNMSATALKQEFDAPAKEIVAPKFNNLIDELEAETAAASLGATAPEGRSGDTVQEVIEDISLDLAQLEGSVLPPIIEDSHTHENKALLDTYEQTEADLASAVTNTHTHSNKSVIDKLGESSGTPTYDSSALATESYVATAISGKADKSEIPDISGKMDIDGNNSASTVYFGKLTVSTQLKSTSEITNGTGCSAPRYGYAGGDHTRGTTNCQHVCGKWNDNKDTTLFEVGNGSQGYTSNAFEVYSDGSLSTDNGTTKVKLENLVEKYIEQSTYTDSGIYRTFTFTDARITTTGRYEYYCNVINKNPSDVTVSSGSMSVEFAISDGVTVCGVTIK